MINYSMQSSRAAPKCFEVAPVQNTLHSVGMPCLRVERLRLDPPKSGFSPTVLLAKNVGELEGLRMVNYDPKLLCITSESVCRIPAVEWTLRSATGVYVLQLHLG